MAKKTVYVLRGVPGSGKTFLANALKDALGAEIFSADDYFTKKDGKYCFDKAKLTEAHNDCFKRFVDALERDVECLVLHNTSICKWEYEDYLEEAHKRGYNHIICDMKSTFRNVHGVPASTVHSMRRRFEK